MHDLIGGSGGFRRPAMILSVEPSVSVSRGSWAVSTSVPMALYREIGWPASRTRSMARTGMQRSPTIRSSSPSHSLLRARRGDAEHTRRRSRKRPPPRHVRPTAGSAARDEGPPRGANEFGLPIGATTHCGESLGDLVSALPCRSPHPVQPAGAVRRARRGGDWSRHRRFPCRRSLVFGPRADRLSRSFGGGEAIRLTGSRMVPTTFFVDGAGRILDIAGGALADAELSARVSRLLSRTETEVQPIPTTHAM